MSAEPKPCPWVKFPFCEEDPACVKCGDALSLNHHSEWGDPDFVLCGSCACDTVSELWNTRAESAELSALRAKLKAARKAIEGAMNDMLHTTLARSSTMERLAAALREIGEGA